MNKTMIKDDTTHMLAMMIRSLLFLMLCTTVCCQALPQYDKNTITKTWIMPWLQQYPELEWLLDKDTTMTSEAANQASSCGWLDVTSLRENPAYRFIPASSAIEFNRTLTSLVTTRLMLTGDSKAYDFLTQLQDEKIRLQPQSFSKLHRMMSQAIDATSYQAFITAMVYADLAKSTELKKRLKQKLAITLDDHDDMIVALMQKSTATIASILPSFAQLDTVSQNLVKAMLTQVPLHWAHFVQLEGGSNMLNKLEKRVAQASVSRHMMRLHFLLQVMDVAGALGHKNIRGSLTLTEPVLNHYLFAYEAVSKLLNKEEKAQVLQQYVKARCKALEMNCNQKDTILLTRLACLTRQYDPDFMTRFQQAWHQLPQEEQTRIESQFALNKGINLWQRVPTYMPAFLLNFDKQQKTSPQTLLQAVVCLANLLQKLESHKNDAEPMSFNQLAKSIAARQGQCPRQVDVQQHEVIVQ